MITNKILIFLAREYNNNITNNNSDAERKYLQ